MFGYPILKKVFDHCAANEGDWRHQHSDSAMEHILPILGRLNLTSCNFGPTVTVDKIRKYMKNTRRLMIRDEESSIASEEDLIEINKKIVELYYDV